MTDFDRRTCLRAAGLVGAGITLGACARRVRGSGSCSSGSTSSGTSGDTPTGQLSGTATFPTWTSAAEAAALKKIAADLKTDRRSVILPPGEGQP